MLIDPQGQLQGGWSLDPMTWSLEFADGVSEGFFGDVTGSCWKQDSLKPRRYRFLSLSLIQGEQEGHFFAKMCNDEWAESWSWRDCGRTPISHLWHLEGSHFSVVWLCARAAPQLKSAEKPMQTERETEIHVWKCRQVSHWNCTSKKLRIIFDGRAMLISWGTKQRLHLVNKQTVHQEVERMTAAYMIASDSTSLTPRLDAWASV